jgi:hypothetical protein
MMIRYMPHTPWQRIINWSVIVLLLFSYLFFFPFFPEMYQTGKFTLVSVGTLCIVMVVSFQVIRSRTLLVPKSLPVLGFGILSVASALTLLFTSSNRVESFTDPAAGTAVFLMMTVLLGIMDLYETPTYKKILIWGYILTIGMTYLLSLYIFFGIGKIIFSGVPYLQDPLWNPVGSPLALVAIGLISLPLVISEVIKSVKTKNEAGIAVGVIAGLITFCGSLLILFRYFPTIGTSVEPLGVAWNILLETYKSPAGLFFGAGIDNYLTAFTLGKPAALNLTDIWNLRFTSAPNSVLHVATTMGILGAGALLACIAIVIVPARKTRDWGIQGSLAIALLSLFLVPPHLSIWVTVLILTMIIPTHTSKAHGTPHSKNWIPLVAGISGIAAAILLLSLTIRFAAGEIAFKSSLDMAAANNGTATYNTQIKAIGHNPYKTNFHLTFSQTNLALANSIASNANQSEPLSETDRSLVSEMLRLSIAEAKNATALSPKNILAWENLASVYRSITGVVTGADGWALSAYQQSVLLDPTNPLQRMNLAGMYIRHGRYDDAISQLQVAAILKPDLANTHFNLANVYGLTKQYYKQATELKQTLTLIPTGSGDIATVKNALEKVYPLLTPQELATLTDVKTAEGPSEQLPLAPIEPSIFPTIEPQLELPQLSSPTASQTIPSPTQSPQPSPNPSP